jgi:hypothetical protein
MSMLAPRTLPFRVRLTRRASSGLSASRGGDCSAAGDELLDLSFAIFLDRPYDGDGRADKEAEWNVEKTGGVDGF